MVAGETVDAGDGVGCSDGTGVGADKAVGAGDGVGCGDGTGVGAGVAVGAGDGVGCGGSVGVVLPCSSLPPPHAAAITSDSITSRDAAANRKVFPSGIPIS